MHWDDEPGSKVGSNNKEKVSRIMSQNVNATTNTTAREKVSDRRPILKNRFYLYLTEFFAGMSVMAVELGASRLVAPYFCSNLYQHPGSRNFDYVSDICRYFTSVSNHLFYEWLRKFFQSPEASD
ncbi:MAG: hypothetical protein ACI4C0_09690 [Lachnospiraceae bacterium]